MRLFIGTKLPLAHYDQMKKELSPFLVGNWMEPKNLHMTWIFLGEFPDAKPIINALKGIAIPRFTITAQGLHLFRGQVLAANCYPHEALTHVHNEIKKRLGFIKIEDEKHFHPHVTIVRINEVKSRKIFALAKLTRETVYAQTDDWTINLFQSELTKEGPSYKSLAAF